MVFLGAGNISGLGYTEFDIAMKGVSSRITMDLRVFVYISIAAILLKLVQIYLEWNEERITSHTNELIENGNKHTLSTDS